MDKAQAAEIQRHMLDASAAINRAAPIIYALDEKEREALDAPLGKIIMALHFELLRAIYTRYPDLRPPDPGRLLLDTILRWDVVLPDSVSEADLHSIIFSVLSSRLQKTAVILTRASERCKTLGLAVDLEVIGARIEALAEADRLEAAGDVRKWRYTEVRLNAEEGRDI